MLSQPDYTYDDSNFYGCVGLRLAFNPIKSPYYKVACAGRNSSEIVIQIYYSEIGNWREREEDSFLVINLSGKVVEYNLISKTLHEIYDMGSNQVADDYLHGFIPPFAMYDIGSKKVDHKVHEFIPSFASV
ncbi:hypothetical protein Tco_1247449 [Tanacetum coccineum]